MARYGAEEQCRRLRRPAASPRDAASCNAGLRCASSTTLSFEAAASARPALDSKSRRCDHGAFC